MTTAQPQTCPECGRVPARWSRGVCKRCYLQHWRAGTVDLLLAPRTRPDLAARTEKRCPRCEQTKPVEAFAVARGRGDGRMGWCRDCYAEQRRKKGLAHWRNYELGRRYGIGVEEYDALLAEQGGTCALCPAVSTERFALAVDHDHATGRVRGLLCANCNRGLGLFRDHPERLDRAASYLREHAGAPTT